MWRLSAGWVAAGQNGLHLCDEIGIKNPIRLLERGHNSNHAP